MDFNFADFRTVAVWLALMIAPGGLGRGGGGGRCDYGAFAFAFGVRWTG